MFALLGALLMGFPGLALGYPDQVVLAAYDTLHADEFFREWSGGGDLAGTASVDAAGTTVTGVGTSWATGDDSLGAGDRLLLGAQVATIESVTSDTELEIAVAHADGLVGQAIYRAGRGFRVESTTVPVDVAMPYWTIGIGTLPEYSPAVGRLQSQPSAQITFVYELDQHPLRDDVASWAGLAQRVIAVMVSTGQIVRLCVARFGGEPLVYKVVSAVPGEGVLRSGERDFIPAPAVQISWEGMDPIDRATIAQRW